MAGNGEKQDKISIIAWSGDLDRLWPVLILSTTAVASGMQASVFFTFWGLFALVKPEAARKSGENWMQKLLALYNPGSIGKAKLSKMNFAGAGPWMLGKLAKDYKTPHPTELLEMARDMGVKIIPCQMTMDMLGLKREHLLEGLPDPVGAATALLELKDAEIQLFV